MLYLWIWSKYNELCICITEPLKYFTGVNKEDTLPTILFSKEKLEMALKANAGKMTEDTDQPGNILCFVFKCLQIKHMYMFLIYTLHKRFCFDENKG